MRSLSYLNITATGTTLLANTGGTTKATGNLTATLSAGQSIVFTYRKDSSESKGMDRAEISNVKYGTGTSTPSTILFDSNVDTYFTITNDTYGFYPSIAVPRITVDVKGRITKAEVANIPIKDGKADTATKATQDGDGNVIKDTYLKYRTLTQAEYDALSSTKNSDNVFYFIN